MRRPAPIGFLLLTALIAAACAQTQAVPEAPSTPEPQAVPGAASGLNGMALDSVPIFPLNRFIIGADAVGPSTEFPVPNTAGNGGTWLRWATGAQTDPDSCAPADIPLVRWEQLRDLGLDAAGITLDPRAVTSGGVFCIRSVAAAQGIVPVLADLGSDDGAMRASSVERQSYHPESPYTADITGVLPIPYPVFRTSPADVSAYPRSPAYNAALYPSTGVVNGYLLNRLPAGTPEAGSYPGSIRDGGVYCVSLRLAYPSNTSAEADRIPDDTTTIFLLTINDDDPRTADAYALRGHDFQRAAGEEDAVREFLLDIVRAESMDDRTRIRLRRNFADSIRSGIAASGVNRSARIVPDVGQRLLPYALQYMPFDARRPVIVLDGILVSSGLGFALANPGHPALPRAWRGDPRRAFERVLDTLCGGDADTAPAFVQLQESSGSDGNIGAAALVTNTIVRRSGGRTQPFVYLPAVMGLEALRLAIPAFRDAVQSPYYYPFALERENAFFRSDLAGEDVTDGMAPLPSETDYYVHHFRTEGVFPSLRDFVQHFRFIAEERRRARVTEPWIPCIQNHAWGFRSGDPAGNPVGDLLWLREPTTRELRLSVNIALACGAKGIWYYQFGSTPGADTARALDEGIRGFLTYDHCMRARNAFGENPWDSMRVFHRTFLRPVGDLLYPLQWEGGWSVEEHADGMIGDALLLRVRTETAAGFDAPASSLAEASLFTDPSSSETFLFLVNKRVDDGGARRFAVSLGSGKGNAASWTVMDLRSGSHSRAEALTQEEAAAGAVSFRTDVAPGMGVLLRLSAGGE